MNPATCAGAARWARFFFVSVLLGTLAFACVNTPLAPQPGVRASDELALIPVPGGAVNAAGGNFRFERRDLALDTRLGRLAIGAVYNSSGGWTWSFDLSYRNGSFRDESGASYALGSLANGAPVPGTRWVKLDATRLKTKGGLLYEFDAATGRLSAMRYSSAPYPILRFAQSQLGASWRTTAIEQCESASACTSLVALEYDASARISLARDFSGRVASFAHDSAGRLTQARDPHDLATGRPGARYEYAGSFLSASVDSDGERVEIASDGAGRALSVRAIGEGDPTWSFDYATANAAGLYVTTARDPLGRNMLFSLDAAGALRSVTNALGELTTYTWTAGRLASVLRPDATLTRYTIANDDVISELQPSGNVVTTSYEPNGVNRDDPRLRAIARISDSLGVRETRSYDAAGRLLTIANGAGESTTFSYRPDEAIASVRAPDGSTVQFDAYGGHGHAARLSLDGSSWASETHDALGNRSSASWPEPATGGVSRIGFDADRNVATLELRDLPESGAPSVQTLVFEHRADGRPLRVLRPYGGESRFGYDALGRLRTLAERSSASETADPAAWSVTTWTHDAAGRVTSVERANGMREEAEYDAVGRVARSRSLRGGVVESDVRFEFASGRLVRAHDAANALDETYAYDSTGRVAEVTHSLGEQTRFAYDARSRLVRSEFIMPGGTPLAALTHGYDAAGRETRLGYLGADLLALGFVNGAHEQTLYGNGLRRKQFRDQSSGRASGRELWRGATRLEKSDYALRAAIGGELTQLRTESLAGGISQEDFAYASATAPPGMDRRVASGAVLSEGLITTERFAYDHLSNLVARTGSWPWIFGTVVTRVAQLTYNAEHNRVLRTSAVGLFGVAGEYRYDAAGFVTAQTATLDEFSIATTFDWNARGQIRSVVTRGTIEASFAYDALGRRRERFANGALRRWRFAGVVEADASDQPTAIDLGEVRIQLDGNHRYRHEDWRGNTALVSNQAGGIETQHAFSAYGRSTSSGAPSDDFVFARGDVLTVGIGELVAIGARLYDPTLARFFAPDPLWSPINQFAYTLGNPVDFWDPSGLHAGSHHDLSRAGINVAKALLGIGLAVVGFGLAAAPAAVALAVGIGVVAVLTLAEAMIEFDKQKGIHAEQTRVERAGRDSAESRGSGSGGYGSGAFSGGFEGRGGRTEVVCSNDGSGWDCTRRSGANISQNPHLWVY